MSRADRASRRLPAGGIIDRDRPLSFRFNGTEFEGFEGDSLASALLANGIRLVARSFKYHRPRGIFTAGEEEPCALVEIGEGARRIPNCRAPCVPLTQGLVARSQNAWPSVNHDLGRVVDWTHGLWPAGFYNKIFKWPSWKFWERAVRRSAGLGRPLEEADPDSYEQVNLHCDLLVCGGGPAGLVATLLASRAGLRVVLAEQGMEFGGHLNAEIFELDGAPASAWTTGVLQELESSTRTILLKRTTVSGIYDHNVTTLSQQGHGGAWRECLWTVRPRRILITTGAIEQGLIFPFNDRPGIMLAGAARQYLNRYAVAPGRRVVIATNNDTAYQTAFDLARHRLNVSAVVDSRPDIASTLKQKMDDLGIPLLRASRISWTRGSPCLQQVGVESIEGKPNGRFDCDLLAVSGGWSPRVHLLAHARGSLRFDDTLRSFVPAQLPPGIAVAGSARGTASLQDCLQEAMRTTQSICTSLGFAPPHYHAPTVTRAPVESLAVEATRIDLEKPRQWIDLAHDVTLGDAQLAVREGFVPVEHFKRFTTTGMSVDQGKTGNLNAFIVLAALTGRATGDIGTTTFRPPYMPVTLSAVAGRNTGEFYAPRRYLPAHELHRQLNGQFEDYGWQRPDCYPLPGETSRAAIHREVLAVRRSVGVFDNSPIGKLEVRGANAAEFLNRLYINNVHSLAVGKVRYGLMLNEQGVLVDDGVFIRLEEDLFLLNTTSAGVDHVLAAMEEFLQCEWRELEVLVDDVTVQWCTFTVAGPRAHRVIEKLTRMRKGRFSRKLDELRHMEATTGHFGHRPARVARVSFSGEASYEISTPALDATSLLQDIMSAGKAHGIEPYGIEALMLLRAEKGYLHIGTDTDGSTTPDDVGWGEVARKKTSDYIGRRSLQLPAALDTNRKQWVGLESRDGKPLVAGSHLLIGENRRPPAVTDGWVSFAAVSPTLQRPIALGLVSSGRQHLGEPVTVCEPQGQRIARIVAPVFYDPNNDRLDKMP